MLLVMAHVRLVYFGFTGVKVEQRQSTSLHKYCYDLRKMKAVEFVNLGGLFFRHHRTRKGGVSYILFRGIGGQETLYLWIEREGETVQPKIRSDKAIPHCQPRICGPSHWGVVMCFFKCPISTDTHSHWLHLIKLNTRIETMQVEDNIRDMREAIPQCQSRISQRYLRVISLYLSLSYLSKCAAPYLPNTTTQTQIRKHRYTNTQR